MPDRVAIRSATAADAETLLDLVDALADYERLARPDAEARERLVQDGFGREPRFETHLAELNGRAVAYAITFETYSSFLARPTLYLEDLFVRPEARRQGVGRQVFEFLAREALRRGCGRMEWAVLDWNQPALDFYEALGARRMSDWCACRLTADDLRRLAETPSGP